MLTLTNTGLTIKISLEHPTENYRKRCIKIMPKKPASYKMELKPLTNSEFLATLVADQC